MFRPGLFTTPVQYQCPVLHEVAFAVHLASAPTTARTGMHRSSVLVRHCKRKARYEECNKSKPVSCQIAICEIHRIPIEFRIASTTVLLALGFISSCATTVCLLTLHLPLRRGYGRPLIPVGHFSSKLYRNSASAWFLRDLGSSPRPSAGITGQP